MAEISKQMNILIGIVIVAVLLAVFVSLGIRTASQLYRKVGPNMALIVYGGSSPRIITNGGTFVTPIRESATTFSLELMSFDVAPQQMLYTSQGVAVNVEAVTQLKVRSDRENILTAAEQFLSKEDEDREALIRLVMEGHLRGIVGQLTVDQLVKDPEMVSEKMRTTSSSDLMKMGLEIVSFTIKEVRDNNEYIVNMGRPEIERIKKEANIAAAIAARDTQIEQAAAVRDSSKATSAAQQVRAEAEAASQTKQAEFQRDLLLKKAAYDAEVKHEQATADKAYDIQANIMQQQVIVEATKIEESEKLAQVRVQEAEIKRRELELQATIQNQAEAERRRIEISAEAERQRTTIEAEGRAAAVRTQGAADAEAIRLRGIAEADVIRARGEAEAAAMRVKAEAYQEYNQAALLDKLISSLPEVVKAMASPLSNIDRITIVSTGGADGQSSLGASRLTGDMVTMLAQIPTLFETLTGLKFEEMLSKIPALQKTKSSDVNTANPTTSPEPVATAMVDASAETPTTLNHMP